MRMARTLILAAGLLAAASPTWSQQTETGGLEGPRSVGIAAYSGGFALIRDRRPVELDKGAYTIAASDLPAAVQRDSVVVTAGDARVVSLRFPLEPLSTTTLLRRFVGQTIKWVTVNPATGEASVRDADLLSLSGGVTVRLDGLIQTNPPGYPAFDVDDPLARVDGALAVSLITPTAGTYALDLRYLTGGIGWRADYAGTLSEDGDRLMLSGFASLSNQTGVDYRGATVSLVAGDVNRRSAAPPQPRLKARAMAMEAADSAALPEQGTVGDYHRYDLPGRTDVPHGQERKIPLFETRAVTVERLYRLGGDAHFATGRSPDGVVRQRPDVILTVTNSEENGLGLPLPAGLVRVYDDGGATPVLLGEDRIGHLAAGQRAELALGQSFDLSAERRQTAFRRVGQRGEFEAAYEITLRNARPDAASVEVVETLFGEWRILEESQLHERRAAGQAVWTVTVPGDGEATLSFRYSVRP